MYDVVVQPTFRKKEIVCFEIDHFSVTVNLSVGDRFSKALHLSVSSEPKLKQNNKIVLEFWCLLSSALPPPVLPTFERRHGVRRSFPGRFATFVDFL